jgi:hypothetical protein
MLHDLQDARRRGVPIVTFNPLKERGLIEFTNPMEATASVYVQAERVIGTAMIETGVLGNEARTGCRENARLLDMGKANSRETLTRRWRGLDSNI